MNAQQAAHPNTEKADRYRARATELRHMAVNEPEGELRTNLLRLAEQYDKLADSVAAIGKPIP